MTVRGAGQRPARACRPPAGPLLRRLLRALMLAPLLPALPVTVRAADTAAAAMPATAVAVRPATDPGPDPARDPALDRALDPAAAGWAAAVGFTAPAAAGPAGTWQLLVQQRQHADALPLARLGQDDPAALRPRAGRNLAYLEDTVRLARQVGDWQLALLARQSATLVASADTLALAADLDAGRSPAADRAWAVHARWRGFAGGGLALGRRHALAPGWQLAWEAQALALGRWQARTLDGRVQYDAASRSYALQVTADRADDRLGFPFQRRFAPHGFGLLAGARVQGEAGPWRLLAGLDDAGWLHWRGLPQQRQVIDSDRETVDALGYVVYRPLIQGRNAQAGLTRWHPARGLLAASRALPGGQRLGASLTLLPGFGALPSITWERPATAPGAPALAAAWRWHERRLDLQLQWQGWRLQAGLDRPGAAARSRAWGLSYSRALGG